MKHLPSVLMKKTIMEIVKHKVQEISMYGTRRDVHLEHFNVLGFQHFQKRPKLSGFILLP